MLEGECWTYCRPFERKHDGRGAYLAVQMQCEGTAAKTARKNKAYASIASAVFRGTRRNFSFQDYINLHARAHEEIRQCNEDEEVAESKKVTDFLVGIQDPTMESAINVVYGDEDKLNNFEACQHFLNTTKVNAENLNRAKGGHRNIAMMDTKGGKGGKSKRKGKKLEKLPDGFKLEDKRNPYEIYRLLSNEQKNLLKTWAEKSKERRMIRMIKQEMKRPADESDDAESGSGEEPEEEQAGKQFGRRAHKKAKKSKR